MDHPVHYICIPTLGNGEHGWEVRFTSPFFLSLAIPRIKGSHYVMPRSLSQGVVHGHLHTGHLSRHFFSDKCTV